MWAFFIDKYRLQVWTAATLDHFHHISTYFVTTSWECALHKYMVTVCTPFLHHPIMWWKYWWKHMYKYSSFTQKFSKNLWIFFYQHIPHVIQWWRKEVGIRYIHNLWFIATFFHQKWSILPWIKFFAKSFLNFFITIRDVLNVPVSVTEQQP